MNQEGRAKDILSFQLANTKDEASRKRFLAYLKSRGLLGKHLKLNFTSENHKKVLQPFRDWENKWRIKGECAVRCLKKNLFSCLHSYDFDKEL